MINGRVKPYRLSNEQIDVICETFSRKYNRNISRIEENETGYKFIDEAGMVIGKKDFDFELNRYGTLQVKDILIDELSETEQNEVEQNDVKDKKGKGKFVLQKGKKLGIVITTAGLAVLTALGVIKGVTDAKKANEASIVENMNTVSVEDASDIVALSWADYAMGEISQRCSSSPYEMVQSMSGEIRTNYYAPVMATYYNYLDQVDSFLPTDVVAETRSKQRETLRSKLASFNKSLEGPYFEDLEFEKTSYAQAVVVDSYGEIVTRYGDFKGELVDSAGDALTYDDTGKWKIYIPVLSIPKNEYGLDNLPDDAVINNGDIYVSIEHYDDFTVEGGIKK